jgi:hypothetical protein
LEDDDEAAATELLLVAADRVEDVAIAQNGKQKKADG